MEVYLIIQEGHEGVASVEAKIIGSIPAESSEHALRIFEKAGFIQFDPVHNRYYGWKHLEVKAYPKPNENKVRPLAHLIWEYHERNQHGSTAEENWREAETMLAIYPPSVIENTKRILETYGT